MKKEDINRLITSRKVWGAILGSISIIAALKVGAPETTVTAITALGALWTTAIAGQAAQDYVKGKNGKQA